jgi:dihydrofolate synthase/folylpolyglutamate synthase
MRFTALQPWLDWQETLHPKAMDFGLERVARVADRMGLRTQVPRTITVAGTNGKGTVTHISAALLQRLGYRTGRYTSPHLLRYNERIAVDGIPATDADLCSAFAAIDAARGPDSLTYFEFGTLAALWWFRAQAVDFQVLEVGLGGRLDAVNLLDPEVAVITGIDLDHQALLGPDRESIGREKAGILREGGRCVLGDPDPPRSVLAEADRLHTRLWQCGRDFQITAQQQFWRPPQPPLPLPALPEAFLAHARGQNAATALAILHALDLCDALTPEDLRAGLTTLIPGRLQHHPGNPAWLFDVAHNPQSARELARWLAEHPVRGPQIAIVGVMQDKERTAMWQPFAPSIDHWLPIDLPSPRALPAMALRVELAEQFPQRPIHVLDNVHAARACALNLAKDQGRIVVFGSFLTVQALLETEVPG